jgi:hypothetical protein
MLYREIIAVCSEIHTKHVNTLCGQNVEFLGAFAKLRRATVSVAVSVRPHETIRLPLDEFLMKFDICLFFEKPVDKNTSFLKTDKSNGRALYVKTDVYLGEYLATFL